MQQQEQAQQEQQQQEQPWMVTSEHGSVSLKVMNGDGDGGGWKHETQASSLSLSLVVDEAPPCGQTMEDVKIFVKALLAGDKMFGLTAMILPLAGFLPDCYDTTTCR
jgi:hypothetical protein